jgi:hypothetical protein
MSCEDCDDEPVVWTMEPLQLPKHLEGVVAYDPLADFPRKGSIEFPDGSVAYVTTLTPTSYETDDGFSLVVSGSVTKYVSAGERFMNWLSIIMMIVQFIIGRIQPAALNGGTIRPQAFKKKDIRKIAQAIHEVEPQLNFDCLLKVLPGLLDDLLEVVKTKGFQDYAALISAGLPHLVTLIKCQVGVSASADDPYLNQEITNKIITCGFKALGTYMSTGNIGSAISGFLSCVLSNVGGGGGNDDDDDNGGGGGGGGGIDPTKPILRDVSRCG